MHQRLSNARLAAVLAVAAVLFGAGMVSGAAGDFLVIGSEANNAGTGHDTQLVANSDVITFKVYQQGLGTALMGYVARTSGSGRGVYGRTDSPNGDGIQARNGATTDGSGAGLRVFGGVNDGIVATTEDAIAIRGQALDCEGFLCGATGVYGIGVGLAGGVQGDGPLGVVGSSTIGTDGFGLYTNDDALVGGDLEVLGTCTGCAMATNAINGGGTELASGDAVKALGVTTDDAGNLLVVVGPASAGDTVFGIVAGATKSVTSGTVDAKTTVYKPSGESVASNGSLKVVTSGIVTFAAADGSGGEIAIGDPLVASDTAKTLTKAGDEVGTTQIVGIALGILADGRVAVYLD